MMMLSLSSTLLTSCTEAVILTNIVGYITKKVGV